MQVASQRSASRASSRLVKAFSSHAVARPAASSPRALPRLGSPLLQQAMTRRAALHLPRQQRLALCAAAATETPEETYTYQAEVHVLQAFLRLSAMSGRGQSRGGG
jgi:hypothetical protein